MIKYNICIGCDKLSYSSSSAFLNEIVHEYDARLINNTEAINTHNNIYKYFTYIISEENILGFISELPFNYFIKYILDDIFLQMALQKGNKYTKSYIYKNPFLEDMRSDYKKHLNHLDLQLYDMAMYIQENHNF